jgi:hypothetical protein
MVDGALYWLRRKTAGYRLKESDLSFFARRSTTGKYGALRSS